MGNSTPTPKPNVKPYDVPIDFSDYLEVADAEYRKHQRACKLIFQELLRELEQNGVFHGQSAAEIADGFGWCRSEVWKAAVYMESRGLIGCNLDTPEGDNPCYCDSCCAGRSWLFIKFDPTHDELDARWRKHDQLVAEAKQEQTEPRTVVHRPSLVRPNAPAAVGIVYLFRAGTRYKIGVTTNVQRRLDQLNGGQSPFPVEVIHHVSGPGYTAFEAELHARCADRRVRGEWFEFEPDYIAAVIESMNEWAASVAKGD